MRRAILTCLAALMLLSSTPCAAFAKDGKDAWRKDEIVARLKKARAENRRVVIHFREGYDVTGRVGELRERGFTFEPDGKDSTLLLNRTDMSVGILYEDVDGVQHPSKLRKFFKGVRMGALGVSAFFIVLPVYSIQALLGKRIEC